MYLDRENVSKENCRMILGKGNCKCHENILTTIFEQK